MHRVPQGLSAVLWTSELEDRSLQAAQEAKELLKSQGSRLEIPKLPVKPLSERPNEDIRRLDGRRASYMSYDLQKRVFRIFQLFWIGL